MDTLNKILEELEELSGDDLRQLQAVVRDRLSSEEATVPQQEDAFEKSLVDAGLLEIPSSQATPAAGRFQPIAVEGEPISESIVRERR